MSATIHIAGRTIGAGQRVFIIAEAGVNHKLEPQDLARIGARDSLEVACRLIDAAKAAGADAVKFQSFSADALQYAGTPKPHYQHKSTGTDSEASYYDTLKKLETSRDEERAIADYCAKQGIMFLSTPYDAASADFLDQELKVPMFKLASIELNNHLFTKYVAAKGKPVIISTGLSTMEDVRAAMAVARAHHYISRTILLQCTSNYPTEPKDMHLAVLAAYQKEFPEAVVGLSDHSAGAVAAIGAVPLGAAVLEKHCTLDPAFAGPDHSASLSPDALVAWVQSVRDIEASLGSSEKILTDAERGNMTMRKYLLVGPAKKGTLVTEELLSAARTGEGILPTEKNLLHIVGKRLTVDLDKPTPFSWDLII